jgi:hypothetical protein
VSDIEPYGVLDIQMYTYPIGDHTIGVSLIEKDVPRRHGAHGGNAVAVQVTYDDRLILSSDEHFATLGDFGLGEYLVGGITTCMTHHMKYWTTWQSFADTVLEVAAPEVCPPTIDLQDLHLNGVRVHESNLAARHIEQLTDFQAAWWLQNLHDSDDDMSAIEVLSDIGRAAFSSLAEQNREWFDKEFLNKGPHSG